MNEKNNEAKKTADHKTSYKEYWQAFLEYLGRPKTVFDLKDRAKALLLLCIIIIILQKVVEMLTD